jgi:hypothetical protein
MMSKKLSMALVIGAAMTLTFGTANEAQARFGRGHGSNGSNGSSGSHGGYSSNGSGGSFGGLFSRRHNNSGHNECYTESHSSCGSHGGSYSTSSSYESHEHGTQQGGPGTPPPAPADPGGARDGGAANQESPKPIIVADRKENAAIVATARRFGRMLR